MMMSNPFLFFLAIVGYVESLQQVVLLHSAVRQYRWESFKSVKNWCNIINNTVK